jgi:D-alanyl-D-alanine carboxypeptidase (penicillin-binding protein 5/6)
MSELVRRIVVGIGLMAAMPVFGAPAPPVVTADSAIMVDAVTGTVLFEKRCHKRRPPASTTKIMTAILALEHGDLDETVKASSKACKTPFGSLHLKPGETLTLNDLVRGMLLRSANDAAVCAAEHIAVSEKKFVEMMNAKAKELGAKDTHFVNPHGLYNPEHYSTAYDLALMARHACRIPLFNEMVSMKTTTIGRSVNQKDAFIRSTARFLWKYDGADGIKTGYTREAGHCFVGSATRHGWRLIAVILKSKDVNADAAALLDYGFKFFKLVAFAKVNETVTTTRVAGGVVDEVRLLPTTDLALVVRNSAEAEPRIELDVKEAVAPVQKGDKLGTLTAYMDDRKIGSVDLIAADSVERTPAAAIWWWVRSLFAAACIFVVGFVAYGTAVAEAARRRRRRLAAGS